MPANDPKNTQHPDIQQSSRVRSLLMKKLAAAAKVIFDFLTILFLGVFLALLTILPWLLRVGAILLWLTGGYTAVMAIQIIYSPFSNREELLALQFAVILLMVALVMILFLVRRRYLWGGLALGGFLAYELASNATRLANSEYAGLIFRVLPPALLSVGMIVITIRLKKLRSGHKLRSRYPPFLWISKLISRGGGAVGPKQ